MQKTLTLIVVVALGGVLYATNPDETAFRDHVRARVEARLADQAGDGRLGRLLTGLGSDVLGSLAGRLSTRKDFALFSIYTIDAGGDGGDDDQWRFVGIARQFIEIEQPD